ncbi:hypothetical protein Tco_1285170 [Tanacetum coccineum]
MNTAEIDSMYDILMMSYVSVIHNRIVLEEELRNTKERLDESENERNRVVVDLHETKELANAGLSPTKVVHEQLENLQRGNRNGSSPPQSSVARRGNNFDTSRGTKESKEEIGILKNEVRSTMEAEEKSKRAMDGCAVS